MIDLIEVEKERLLDEVSFLWVLVYFMSIEYLLCAREVMNHHGHPSTQQRNPN